MPKNKQKIQLSESLKLGVSDPSSQSTLYKTGGIILTIFSVLLAANIVKNLITAHTVSSQALATSQNVQPAVLGAYSQTTYSTYTVQTGDTLFSIAQANNTSWEILAELNNLKAPYKLKLGSSLKVPVQQ